MLVNLDLSAVVIRDGCLAAFSADWLVQSLPLLSSRQLCCRWGPSDTGRAGTLTDRLKTVPLRPSSSLAAYASADTTRLVTSSVMQSYHWLQVIMSSWLREIYIARSLGKVACHPLKQHLWQRFPHISVIQTPYSLNGRWLIMVYVCLYWNFKASFKFILVFWTQSNVISGIWAFQDLLRFCYENDGDCWRYYNGRLL